MNVFIIFFIFLALICLIAIIYAGNGEFSLGGADFFARGKELGLSIKEIKTLKKTADILNMERPLTILGSIDNLNKAISQLSIKLEKEGFIEEDVIELLDDLYAYKKKIEINKIEKRNLIQSSQEIDKDQLVKVVLPNSSRPFVGVVAENCFDHIIIDFSNDSSFPTNHRFEGVINVYFWKQNDAGYYFETIIVDGSLNRRWKVAHSNSLIRNQKRKELRVDIELQGYIYKLIDINTRNSNAEGFSGSFVQIKNISDGGAALLLNGKIQDGVALKLEFKLLDKHIVVCGLIMDIKYDSRLNCSLVRFKFVEPEALMVSYIRSFIYNINNEQDLIKRENIGKSVDNHSTINNNRNSDVEDEEVGEVEYITEDCEIYS